MYKCNSREIHYASLQKLSGMPETAWEWGVRSESVALGDLWAGSELALPEPPATQAGRVGAASQLEGGG